MDWPSDTTWHPHRSEEHTSELQSPCNIVWRLLLEKINAKGQGDMRDKDKALMKSTKTENSVNAAVKYRLGVQQYQTCHAGREGFALFFLKESLKYLVLHSSPTRRASD